ncbi:YjbH domain-containing protein, partial [Escherichia coli]
MISEELATAAALRQQQALLTRLAELTADSSADDAAAINALRQQIQALKVTGRQKINLDPDIVRVAERGNPPLQGNYTLWVGPPPSTVTLFGLISRPGKQSFTPGRDVTSYLSDQSLLSGADRSYAWVVYPDGRTQKAPVAYWNKRHVEPMPGSIIYVGLADSVWSETPDALNADSVEAFSGDQTYKDKAFDLKLRLWEESYWLPQVAVGARDIGGTGLFDAEYLVASKAWGPFDFTLGLGWGYLGTSGNVKNPLCSASDKYCYRDNSYKQAGSIDGSQMFHGPASLFGGVEYQTPWQPLRLKLEYEGNNYQQDFAGKLEQKSKFNVGAIYRVTDWADVNLSYERGNTFMFGVTLRTNFNDLLTLLKYNAGLADPQIQTKGDTLYVTGEQVKYRDSREGIIRANRIVMNDLPDGIKTIRITENRLNMPQVTTETDVASLKNHLAGEPLGHETTLAQKRVEPVVPQSTEQGWYIDKSRFDFHIDPVLNQSVGGPENFYMYQLGVMGTADLWLTDH